MTNKILLALIVALSLSSCATKKNLYYMQDIDSQNNNTLNYVNSIIQPNDVMRITVSALNPEAAEIYNMQMGGQQGGGGGGMAPGMLALTGYLVSPEYTITFPILGKIPVKGMTTIELADDITERLVSGGHLKNPTVDVRLVNAKFTVIGEPERAQTVTFTEQNITLIQALGLAGGLGINTIRKDVKIVREEKGVREIANIDLTQTDWMDGPYYFIKPNDVILVKPNDPGVKRAGYITNPAALIGIVSSLASLVVAYILTQ
jgi:polysaccharide export outer membrane protein